MQSRPIQEQCTTKLGKESFFGLVFDLVPKIQENIRRQVLPMSKDLGHHIQLKYELDKLIREINVSEEDDKYAIAAEELRSLCYSY